MRRIPLLLLCLASPVVSGCAMFGITPDSKLNVNRGEYHDEFTIGREARGTEQLEQEPDGMGKWLYSPKARAIDRDLGVEN